MKKFLGIFVVLAMVLAMLPMTVFAVPGTYELSVGFSEHIDLYADDAVTLVVNAKDQDVILTVDGEGTYYEWYIDNGMQQFTPEIGGSYQLKLQAGNTYELTLVSENSLDDQVLLVTLTAPKLGSEENPAELNMGENSATVDGFTPYFFGFTAAEAGKLEIAIDTAKCSDWSFQINTKQSGGTVKVGDTNYSDVEPVVSSETVVVQAGDVVTVCVNTANFGVEGTIYFNASFTAGDFSGEGEGGEGGGDIGQIGGGDVTIENEAVTKAAPWTYTFNTEGPGSLRVVMGECTPGWTYKIQYPNGEESIYYTASQFSVGPDCTHDLTDAGEYTVLIWAYNNTLYDTANGTISATLTYTPSSGDVEIPKEEYVVSDIILGLGENSLTLDDTAITTIYEFSPEETGLYKFTVGDSAALVGYWGAGSFFVQDLTENKTNSIEHELSAVGQSIMVGVSNVEGEFTMTIEKVGNAGGIQEIEYIDYIVKHVPLGKNLVDVPADAQLNKVDISKAYNLVKDENGFYHLGSVDGPLVYVNLLSEGFDIINAFFGGYGAMTMRGKYTAPDGTVTHYDFLSAMRNYANVIYDSDYDNGLYPLTDDLMIFMKAFGTNQGWYNPGTSPFEGMQSEFNPDSAWMVTCCYFGEVYEAPEYNPDAGDYSVAALVVSMMAATAGAVVLTKKKEF